MISVSFPTLQAVEIISGFLDMARSRENNLLVLFQDIQPVHRLHDLPVVPRYQDQRIEKLRSARLQAPLWHRQNF